MYIENPRESADKVLDIVLQEVKNIDSDYFVVLGSYQNGREQGHSIQASCVKGRWIGWAEHRNSDNIVVYSGMDNMQSISDEMYENRREFETPKEAANYILQLIKTDLGEKLK